MYVTRSVTYKQSEEEGIAREFTEKPLNLNVFSGFLKDMKDEEPGIDSLIVFQIIGSYIAKSLVGLLVLATFK